MPHGASHVWQDAIERQHLRELFWRSVLQRIAPATMGLSSTPVGAVRATADGQAAPAAATSEEGERWLKVSGVKMKTKRRMWRRRRRRRTRWRTRGEREGEAKAVEGKAAAAKKGRAAGSEEEEDEKGGLSRRVGRRASALLRLSVRRPHS